MKTSLNTRQNFLSYFFYKLKQSQPQWKKLNAFGGAAGSVFLSYLLAVPSATVSYLRPALTILHKSFAPVGRALLAILAWRKALAGSFTINNRIFAGLILVSMVAPLSACIHMLPGMKDLVDAEWYYRCWYNLYLVLGPYLFSLCIVLACFLWLQPINKRIKFSKKDISFQLTRCLSLPTGLIIGKIVWLIFCKSNDDFESIGNPWFFVGGVVLGYSILRILEYFVWRQEHVMNALIDSLQGVYDIENIDHKQRQEIAKPYWQELRQFHSKY